MQKIFESRYFSNFSINDDSLYKVKSQSIELVKEQRKPYNTTIFLSHKHDDLEDLKDIIGFLQSRYGVEVYIDSKDPQMPHKTSGETATRIKSIIDKCDRFILLATEGAIDSKWCNWELGFGDAKKYRSKIALFPIKPKDSYDYQYKGNEYLEIYPHIIYYDGSEKYNDGTYVKQGFYVGYLKEDGLTTNITPLETWLK